MRVIQRICSILLLLVTFGASALYAQTYDKLWKQVEQAQKKSLPQTVIKLADTPLTDICWNLVNSQ